MLEEIYTYMVTAAIYGEPDRSEYFGRLLRAGDSGLEWRPR